MLDRYRQAFAAVRRSYPPEKAQEEACTEIAAFVLYRPLSFVVTPFFLWAGCSADAVTALAGLLAGGMLVAALAAGPYACGTVVALGIFIQILDCVDGNIARVTGRSSPVGGLLDGLCTLLFWVFYFCAVGVLAGADAGGWAGRHGREIGLALAALMLAQRAMEDSSVQFLPERVRWEPPVPAVVPRFNLKRLAKLLEHVIAFGGLGAAGALHAVPLFLAGLAAYQLTVLALWWPRFARAVYLRSRTRSQIRDDRREREDAG